LNTPFDSAVCADAALSDISAEQIEFFAKNARTKRGFPLDGDAAPQAVLEHLHLVREGRPTNAAVLLFGNEPQRFLKSSGIKCAHFPGTNVPDPTPPHQVYERPVFDLIPKALHFVISKMRTDAPSVYEIPLEAVREALVNAVAHRDYSSSQSIQVTLFSDRLEIWSPGVLPSSLTLAMLRQFHGSVPVNPLLATTLYWSTYMKQEGLGIGDIDLPPENWAI
jgi:predicted HTH transcriptional regulator